MTIIAKKVSKMNGDVRVAFDIIKSAFVELFNRVKHHKSEKEEESKNNEGGSMPEDSSIKVTFDLVLKVFADKYGSKLP